MKPSPIPPEKLAALSALKAAERAAYADYMAVCLDMPQTFAEKQSDPRFPEFINLQNRHNAACQAVWDGEVSLRAEFPWLRSITWRENDPDCSWDWRSACYAWAHDETFRLYPSLAGLKERERAAAKVYDPAQLEVGKHYLNDKGAALTITRSTHRGRCVYAGAVKLPKPPARRNYWDSCRSYFEITAEEKELIERANADYTRIAEELLATSQHPNPA